MDRGTQCCLQCGPKLGALRQRLPRTFCLLLDNDPPCTLSVGQRPTLYSVRWTTTHLVLSPLDSDPPCTLSVGQRPTLYSVRWTTTHLVTSPLDNEHHGPTTQTWGFLTEHNLSAQQRVYVLRVERATSEKHPHTVLKSSEERKAHVSLRKSITTKWVSIEMSGSRYGVCIAVIS